MTQENRESTIRGSRRRAAWLLALAMVAPVSAAQAHSATVGWTPVIAKLVNFSVLVGLLVYLLRNLVVTHLQTREGTIRKDLADGTALRRSAERQLADVHVRLAQIPAELESLRRLGQDELAGERVRLNAATQKEREQLLERTRRDIDVQFRQARRALVEHVAELSMDRARTRLVREITPDDQARLIDRYVAEVQS